MKVMFKIYEKKFKTLFPLKSKIKTRSVNPLNVVSEHGLQQYMVTDVKRENLFAQFWVLFLKSERTFIIFTRNNEMFKMTSKTIFLKQIRYTVGTKLWHRYVQIR